MSATWQAGRGLFWGWQETDRTQSQRSSLLCSMPTPLIGVTTAWLNTEVLTAAASGAVNPVRDKSNKHQTTPNFPRGCHHSPGLELSPRYPGQPAASGMDSVLPAGLCCKTSPCGLHILRLMLPRDSELAREAFLNHSGKSSNYIIPPYHPKSTPHYLKPCHIWQDGSVGKGTKPDNLSSIPRTFHAVERKEWLLRVVI